jgi:nucleolar pre-ribosomal-associated protein 2
MTYLGSLSPPAPSGLSTNITRKSSLSWKLLGYLIRVIPATNTAGILAEKKFMLILNKTLEEAKQAATVDITSENLATKEEKSSKASKKRKRSGDFVADSSSGGNLDLLVAISTVIEHMVKTTKSNTDVSSLLRSGAFSSEYMKTVLRTTGEEAAAILGLWLSLSDGALSSNFMDDAMTMTWLSPFIEVWELRFPGTEDAVKFSLHCSEYLLPLLQKGMAGKNKALIWRPELEQLAARNIIIPAKIAASESAESNLLSSLTRLSVITDPANAPLLFDISILSLQPQARKRPQDEKWLQSIFSTLKEAMPSHRQEDNVNAVQAMLNSAIKYKIGFELSLLRSIAMEYAISDDVTNWKLLSTLINLDSNVFLMPNQEMDLLTEILPRITAACAESSWQVLYDEVVFNIVVPLMGEFAKARDLSGFIRHWFTQLVMFERLQPETNFSQVRRFSVWEDDALQDELAKLLESSLTIRQILSLLEWLSEEVKEHPNAVCVILEALCLSIRSYEVIDAVGVLPYNIMFEKGTSQKLIQRYRWRSWRLLSRIISWNGTEQLESISQLWANNIQPYDSFSVHLLTSDSNDLEELEVVRCGCVAWKFARKGSPMEVLARACMVDLLKWIAQRVKLFSSDLQRQLKVGNEVSGLENTLDVALGTTTFRLVSLVLVDYPEVLR